MSLMAKSNMSTLQAAFTKYFQIKQQSEMCSEHAGNN